MKILDYLSLNVDNLSVKDRLLEAKLAKEMCSYGGFTLRVKIPKHLT